MKKTHAALLGAMMWVAFVLAVSPSWRQGFASDPWWHNFLRVTGGLAAMYLAFFVALGLPDWVKKRSEKRKS